MAAFSRPSLRSSSRSGGLDDLPATDIQHNPSHSNYRGKRARGLYSVDHHAQPLKKQKVHVQKCFRTKAGDPKCEAKETLARNVAKHFVAQLDGSRKPRHVQQHVTELTSTIITKDSTPEVNDAVSGNIVIPSRTDKRSLRSHDGGSRSKSELALYFLNYDELVSTEAKDPDFLTTDTQIYIVEEPAKPTSLPPSTPIKNVVPRTRSPTNLQSPVLNGYGRPPERPNNDSESLNNAQRIDFSSIGRHAGSDAENALADAMYFKAHRRAERQEKQLRNIEKERAQHEKVQLERLLDGLKGHDWLRVMGISGITDSEKRAFEPKRDYFIHEVTTLIDKFKAWKEEEKRRKVEKEQNLQAEGEDESESEYDASNGDPPNYSDVDAWAARQLHQEANSAEGTQVGASRKKHGKAMMPSLPVEKPFTSFYAKPYLRDAAIGKHRRGRTRFAFGQPLPNVLEKVFRLPSDMLSQDAIAASARSRRRARRESKDY